ncbi:MAG: hypothetical protein LBL07_16195 [Tannerella sp.]|nr:hypothetical protein [Tannerella sp.]
MCRVGHRQPSTPSVTSGNPLRDVLSRTLSGILQDADSTVACEAGPESGANASQPMYANRAWVAVADSMLIVPTNSTYRQGAGTSMVTFSAGYGGSICNAGRQAVDYGTAAGEGIPVAPRRLEPRQLRLASRQTDRGKVRHHALRHAGRLWRRDVPRRI